MSAFSPTSPFQAPDHKKMLIDRLMEQYQDSANRASGLATVGSPMHPLSALNPTPHMGPSALPGVTGPRQVLMPQSHPFIPVRGG